MTTANLTAELLANAAVDIAQAGNNLVGFDANATVGLTLEDFQAAWQVLAIAVVFNVKRAEDLPSVWLGREVINGDAHDLRFLDKPGTIVGLKAKGPAKHDTSGFVQIVKRSDYATASVTSLATV